MPRLRNSGKRFIKKRRKGLRDPKLEIAMVWLMLLIGFSAGFLLGYVIGRFV